jgi:hypothetical protein
MPNKDDPHDGQKCRWSVVSFQLRVSPMIVTSTVGQTAKKFPTDPVSLRHVRQWQKPVRTGGPLTANRTLSQLQPPIRLSTAFPSPRKLFANQVDHKLFRNSLEKRSAGHALMKNFSLIGTQQIAHMFTA